MAPTKRLVRKPRYSPFLEKTPTYGWNMFVVAQDKIEAFLNQLTGHAVSHTTIKIAPTNDPKQFLVTFYWGGTPA